MSDKPSVLWAQQTPVPPVCCPNAPFTPPDPAASTVGPLPALVEAPQGQKAITIFDLSPKRKKIYRLKCWQQQNHCNHMTVLDHFKWKAGFRITENHPNSAGGEQLQPSSPPQRQKLGFVPVFWQPQLWSPLLISTPFPCVMKWSLLPTCTRSPPHISPHSQASI